MLSVLCSNSSTIRSRNRMPNLLAVRDKFTFRNPRCGRFVTRQLYPGGAKRDEKCLKVS